MKNKRFFLMLLLLGGSVLFSCCAGRFPLTLRDIWQICTGAASEAVKGDIFLKIRLPRILFAGMTGAALSAAGMVYQELFQNPLAAPDVLGVSGGAGAGAALAILAGLGSMGVQAFALIFGLLAVFLTLGLGNMIGRRQPVNLILAGVVVKALADAGLMALKYLADPERQLPAIDYWLMGSFHTAMWGQVKVVFPIAGAALFLLWLLRYRLLIVSFGDDEARSLGVSAAGLRLTAVVTATVLVAACVSVTGQVAWTGLIVPHMVRFFSGENMMKNFGICALLGAAFMILVDTAARSLTAAEIPASILTSLAGALFLMAVLLRRTKKGEQVF